MAYHRSADAHIRWVTNNFLNTIRSSATALFITTSGGQRVEAAFKKFFPSQRTWASALRAFFVPTPLNNRGDGGSRRHSKKFFSSQRTWASALRAFFVPTPLNNRGDGGSRRHSKKFLPSQRTWASALPGFPVPALLQQRRKKRGGGIQKSSYRHAADVGVRATGFSFPAFLYKPQKQRFDTISFHTKRLNMFIHPCGRIIIDIPVAPIE